MPPPCPSTTQMRTIFSSYPSNFFFRDSDSRSPHQALDFPEDFLFRNSLCSNRLRNKTATNTRHLQAPKPSWLIADNLSDLVLGGFHARSNFHLYKILFVVKTLACIHKYPAKARPHPMPPRPIFGIGATRGPITTEISCNNCGEDSTKQWDGVILRFIWAANTGCEQYTSGTLQKLCMDLWYLERLDQPETFVQELHHFTLPSGVDPKSYARPGVDPMKELGL